MQISAGVASWKIAESSCLLPAQSVGILDVVWFLDDPTVRSRRTRGNESLALLRKQFDHVEKVGEIHTLKAAFLVKFPPVPVYGP